MQIIQGKNGTNLRKTVYKVKEFVITLLSRTNNNDIHSLFLHIFFILRSIFGIVRPILARDQTLG